MEREEGSDFRKVEGVSTFQCFSTPPCSLRDPPPRAYSATIGPEIHRPAR
jgi:hypothetical protein